MADDELIYLDNNATTQLDPVVIEEMLPFFGKYYGNPSAGYVFAAQARKAVDMARDQLARLLGCEPSEIVFTSGGTESNNAVINSALQFEARGKHVVTSAVEHSAVLRPCQDLTKRGGDVTFLGVDRHGNVDLGELEAAIRPETTLVSMMWANNETGVIFMGRRALARFMLIGDSISPIDRRRGPGKWATRWNRKRRVDCRPGESCRASYGISVGGQSARWFHARPV